MPLRKAFVIVLALAAFSEGTGPNPPVLVQFGIAQRGLSAHLGTLRALGTTGGRALTPAGGGVVSISNVGRYRSNCCVKLSSDLNRTWVSTGTDCSHYSSNCARARPPFLP
jgi:hypothetical protein